VGVNDEFSQDIVTEDVAELDGTEQQQAYHQQLHHQSSYTAPRSARASVVGLTSEELESFNELIRVDHMYSRQPPPLRTPDTSVTSSAPVAGETDRRAVDAERFDLTLNEEPILLPELSTSDLEKLTDCLDMLIDTELMAKACCPTADSVTDNFLCTTGGGMDDEVGYTYDSGVSVDLYASGFIDASSFIQPISSEQNDSVQPMNGSAPSCTQQTIFDPADDFVIRCTSTTQPSAEDSWVESLLCAASPSSKSSGCESDMSSASSVDDQIPFSDDSALFDSCDDPFNDLFPELF